MFDRREVTELLDGVAAQGTVREASFRDATVQVVTDDEDEETVKADNPAALAESWERVRRRLRAELGEDVFSSWFARVELSGIVDGTACLTVPTRFLKSWLEAHYAERLQINCTAEMPGTEAIALSVRQASREGVARSQVPAQKLVKPAQPALSGERSP